MNQSEQINELAGALCAAQTAIKGAVKDSLNPHFKAKYADLASVWEACKEPLTKNGLAVSQVFMPCEAGFISVRTVLMHKSGQWIDGVLALPGGTAQQSGSAITYARRYALAAIVGVTPEDDDGNEASAPQYQQSTQTASAKPSGVNGGGINEGPGQCPKCFCPQGKAHATSCPG